LSTADIHSSGLLRTPAIAALAKLPEAECAAGDIAAFIGASETGLPESNGIAL